MAKSKESKPVETQPIGEVIEKVTPERVEIEDMPLNNIRDYRLYNEAARKINKRLKTLRYPIKQCPVELHPKQRILFQRNDQPENPLPVYLSNHLIHFEQTLIPGREYDLPVCVVNHLANRGYPVWKWAEGKNGARETVIDSRKPRFSITSVYTED